MNSNLKIAAVAVLSSIVTLGGYKLSGLDERDVILNESNTSTGLNKLVDFNGAADTPGSFTYAAGVSTPSVVHIKASAVRQMRQQRMPSIFEEFFGGDDFSQGQPRSQQQQSSGSGVIISQDGYIATNNHVIEGADELEVITSDNQSYPAKVIGRDPSTDIAVIKIEKNGLSAMTFGNSDNVRVGEWVLAVGNPFSLESTVTAGIISAIGRDISILKNKMSQEMQRSGEAPTGDTPIESFIQTDAAVNPGNSGGALVNLRGELVGINTAIASPNGAYAGYAFAVPSSIVKKVTADIIKFGNVQRGYLGLVPVELNNRNAKEYDSKLTDGIYAIEVPKGGAAYAAGIRQGDVITEIDGVATTSEPRFRELIGRKRPGDKIKIVANRSGKIQNFEVTLLDREKGNLALRGEAPNTGAVSNLGIELENLSANVKQKMGVRNGVKVSKLYPDGEIARNTDIKEGFVITRVGNTRVDSADDFKKAMKIARDEKEDGVLICGVYEGYSRNYCFGIALNQ